MIPIGNPRLLRTAVPFDRCAYLIDLALGMSARIARIGNEIAHWPVGDGQPRRQCSRCFVHEREPVRDDRAKLFLPAILSAVELVTEATFRPLHKERVPPSHSNGVRAFARIVTCSEVSAT